ncbi:MAG: bifunctional diaminohydroxyphosphoribosylaminopyrimidine deaminase/5-amino-6-(5-phosphoribosylamino)uracil reductase RibD [Clostridia bacterium]|nr:bifunctional diaminohydroxyphosphoribosylaminopyrimidine deaminase/5-amino-6-(5-phosphoribosylamino)uracil reductase RibD [Clostridia bacterium]
MNDEEYMHIALKLAEKGRGRVSPNPMVGAVIVKDGRIIGEGYHEKYGEQHAERKAIFSCTQPPSSADLYVNLEPCCHYGRQPPCVDAILESGIKRVVIGSADPNPQVCGNGIRSLRENGVIVTENVLREECLRLNQIFFHYIKTKQPFVIMKYAMTMDGKTAAYTGESEWITGEAARMHVQQQRRHFSAVMVGVGTVIADNPMLTCRIDSEKKLVRIICDSWLRTPYDAYVVTSAAQMPTYIATCCNDGDKQAAYVNAGCRVIVTKQRNGHTDLKELMSILGSEGIDSVILEGGGTLNWSALESGIVQKIQAYIAPKLLGGRAAPTPADGVGFPTLSDAVMLKNTVITRIGEDFLIESEVDRNVHGNC